MTQETNKQAQTAAHALSKRAWWPPNHAALAAFVAHIEGRKPPVVCAFDWDNTCVFGDVGDMAFAWQLSAARLTLSPAALAASWLPIGESLARGSFDVPTSKRIAEGRSWLGAALDAWEALHTQKPASLTGPFSSSPSWQAHHHRFRAGMQAAMRAFVSVGDEKTIADTFAAVAYMWPSDGGAALEADLDALLSFNDACTKSERWQVAAVGSTPAIDTAVPTKVVALPEMRELFGALTQAGALPAVVTASPEPLVRALSQRWGYAVAPAHVIGMPSAGMLADDPSHARTYRAGKVDAIRRRLPREPAMVAGDAMTDYEMLTAFKKLQVRLLIERLPMAAPLRKLAEDAQKTCEVPPFTEPSCTTLVQARNERSSTFSAGPPAI